MAYAAHCGDGLLKVDAEWADGMQLLHRHCDYSAIVILPTLEVGIVRSVDVQMGFVM
jgi:hypothetical protein